MCVQWSEAVNEVKLLMEKMMMVQQQGEEVTQEEMVTRFERERTESLLEPVDGMNTHTDNSVHFHTWSWIITIHPINHIKYNRHNNIECIFPLRWTFPMLLLWMWRTKAHKFAPCFHSIFLCFLFLHSVICFSVQHSALPDCVSRFVAEADFIYQDFSPRGVQAPPTMRAQVQYSYIFILKHRITDLKALFCWSL